MPGNRVLRDIVWRGAFDGTRYARLLVCYGDSVIEAIWDERLGELTAARDDRSGELDLYYAGKKSTALRIMVDERLAKRKARRVGRYQ